MRIYLLALALLGQAACASVPPPMPSPCAAASYVPLSGDERDAAIKSMAPSDRTHLAFDLVQCLENPDPAIRDGFAYESYVTLLRGDLIETHAIRDLKGRLLENLEHADEDPGGFRGPFAALVLSEVARTDRLAAWMDDDERSELVSAAAIFLSGLEDYRGFDDRDGWRHGIAHTADLLMQLSLNPNLTGDQAQAILVVVAGKVAPDGHAYVFGESERLAAPVLYLARSGLVAADAWNVWFATLGPEGDPVAWQGAYTTEAGLARLHNTRAFAEAVYVSATASGDPAFGPVSGAALNLLKVLP